jgi:hypothetical protein
MVQLFCKVKGTTEPDERRGHVVIENVRDYLLCISGFGNLVNDQFQCRRQSPRQDPANGFLRKVTALVVALVDAALL